jgi:hypothetical protein
MKKFKIKHAIELTKKIINMGKFPNWDELTLGR